MTCSGDGAVADILKSAKDDVVAGLDEFGRSPIQVFADVLLKFLLDDVEALSSPFKYTPTKVPLLIKV